MPSFSNNNPHPRLQHIPTYGVQLSRANAAFDAMRALDRAWKEQPELLENEYFTALRDTAYARFLAEFEAL